MVGRARPVGRGETEGEHRRTAPREGLRLASGRGQRLEQRSGSDIGSDPSQLSFHFYGVVEALRAFERTPSAGTPRARCSDRDERSSGR